MNVKSLTKTAKPWFHLLAGSTSDATNALWALNGHETAMRIVRGRKATAAQSFFDEASAALQFPYYFGENWDAFHDCINDLEWLKAKAVIVGVLEANKVLEASPTDAAKLASVLQSAAEHWNHPAKPGVAKPFHIVLHCLAGEEAATKTRWQSLGLPLA